LYDTISKSTIKNRQDVTFRRLYEACKCTRITDGKTAYLRGRIPLLMGHSRKSGSHNLSPSSGGKGCGGYRFHVTVWGLTQGCDKVLSKKVQFSYLLQQHVHFC